MVIADEILVLSFVEVVKKQLKQMGEKYGNLSWYPSIENHLFNELYSLFEYVDLNLLPHEQEHFGIPDLPKSDYTNKTAEALLIEHKGELSPSDYLVLRAYVTETDEDTAFLAEQAQMIEPEDMKLTLITTFLRFGSDDEVLDSLPYMMTLKPYMVEEEALQFISLMEVLYNSLNEEGEKDYRQVIDYLAKRWVPQSYRYGLLMLVMPQYPHEERKKILNSLPYPEKIERWEYLLEMGRILYEEKQYVQAGQFLDAFRSKKDLEYYDTEVNYMRMVILRETGYETQSMQLLTEIVFETDEDYTIDDHYYMAIVDLARYYVANNQPKSANHVLARLPDFMLDFMEQLTGDRYYLVMADISLLELNLEEARFYYQKAFEISSDPKVKEKLRSLGGDR